MSAAWAEPAQSNAATTVRTRRIISISVRPDDGAVTSCASITRDNGAISQRTAFQCSRYRSVVVLRSLDGVDAAFRLRPAAPAAGARVFVRLGAAGARHAPDREVTRRR